MIWYTTRALEMGTLCFYVKKYSFSNLALRPNHYNLILDKFAPIMYFGAKYVQDRYAFEKIIPMLALKPLKK